MDDDRLNIASTEKAFHERARTTMRETVTYIADVKEAFLDEPAKFDEFFKLMKDVCDHKIDEANGSAMMAEIIKGHPNLLLGLSVFFPKYSVNKHKKTSHVFREVVKRIKEGKKADGAVPSDSSRTIIPKAKKTIPPKANRPILPKANQTIPPKASRTNFPRVNRTISPKSERTIPSEASRTIPPKAKKTIPPEAKKTIPPEAKRNRIIPSEAKKTIPPEAKKTIPPEAKKSIPPEAKRKRIIPSEAKQTIPPKAKTTTLPEDKLPFFIPKAKRTIPPDDEHGGSAESSNNKKKRASSFMENLEARFQGDGGHVVNSVLQIIRMYTIEGIKSKNEAYHEVVALLHGHVDLIMEFGEYFSDKLSQPKYA